MGNTTDDRIARILAALDAEIERGKTLAEQTTVDATHRFVSARLAGLERARTIVEETQ